MHFNMEVKRVYILTIVVSVGLMDNIVNNWGKFKEYVCLGREQSRQKDDSMQRLSSRIMLGISEEKQRVKCGWETVSK